METIQTLLSHRTIREYKNQEISQTVLDDILAAAVRGSTTGNMQLYSIIITRDEAMKKQLAPLHFNQKMVMEAPLLLTFCADFNRFNKWCEYRGVEPVYDNFQSFNWALIDAVIAAQNACVAAEAHGLGICYLGTTTYTADKIIDLFKLPIGVVPIITLTIGYPKVMPDLTDRLPIEAVVHQETYKDYNKESIDLFFAE
ncbi:MAG: nitroreductase family protein, partial [Bacteroidales bacterium]|nr:nitroreductase family protein [Bacteroidales bacterium]